MIFVIANAENNSLVILLFLEKLNTIYLSCFVPKIFNIQNKEVVLHNGC